MHTHTSNADATTPSEGLDCLKLAVNQLLQAVRCALQEDRDSAEELVRRAGALLGVPEELPTWLDPHETAPIPVLARGGLAPWQIRRVSAHIEANLDRNILTQELAALARLSPSHFCRAFRASFGRPPHDFVTHRRLARAQGMMLGSDAPLGRIAADCGLSDQAHLNKLFRRRVGESPGAWRRARSLGGPPRAPE